MLVGLPATGKSTWAELHMKQHPEKRYTLLSTDNILEQMKVAGLTQLQRALEAAHARPEASSVLNKLISIAASRKRNFLWDQVACI
jgi:heterogeneous nuclear ribonucleoprotein U-like protein 1